MVSRCQESCDLVMFNFATVRPSTSGTWWALSSSESWRRGFSGLDSKALRKCIYFASVAWVDEILYGTLAYPCTFRLSTPTLGVRGNFAKELLLHFSTWTESRHHAAQSPDLRISASIKHLSKADLIHCWQSTDHMQVVESHCNSEWFQSTLCSWSCYGFIPFWLFMRSSLAGLSMHANHISENLRPQ